jgi:hypothetical protein
MVPAVAVKLAVVLAAATVTEAGTVSAPRLLESATVAPPVCETVTVQVELPPEPSVEGAQLSAVRVTGAVRATLAVWVLPFRVAVMVAV